MQNDDVIWFGQRLKRNFRIRRPADREFMQAWQLLGEHRSSRRHVIVWRVPHDNPGRRVVPDGLMRIPFLAFADEAFDDSDETIGPIFHHLMADAAEKQGGMFARTGDPKQNTREFPPTADTFPDIADFPGWNN